MQQYPSDIDRELPGQIEIEESTVQYLQSIFNAVQASIFVVDVLDGKEFRYVGANAVHERLTGRRSSDIRGKTPEQLLPPEQARDVRQHYSDCVRFGTTISYEQYLPFQGIPYWWLTTLTPLKDERSRIYRLVGTSIDITERKQAEEALRLQAEREQLLGVMQERIRRSLDLDRILQRTVKEVRQFLGCDRVLIYRFFPDGSGAIVVESCTSTARPVLGTTIQDSCFSLSSDRVDRYRRGGIQVLEDVRFAGLHPCYLDLLTSLEVRANLVVPILSKIEDYPETSAPLWGLLLAQHCQGPRSWQQSEIDLLQQLAVQVGIAIQHAELHDRVKCLNVALETRVQQRTAELQMSLKYEALVGRITERIRDSLDEGQILQTATRESVQVLQLERARIELYNAERDVATIAYETILKPPSCQGIARRVTDYPEIYRALLQKQVLQFADLVPIDHPALDRVTWLVCPIFDDRGFLGNLWLARPATLIFNELEVKLIRQIADECAIAIRQARLYEASRARGRELESLERLKNEFLKTLSHELRTPIASIRLAAETLEGLLEHKGVLPDENGTIDEILAILDQECRRQGQLIEDLLTLTYLDAETTPAPIEEIDVASWLALLGEMFRKKARERQQEFRLEMENDLPLLYTDSTTLDRIVRELLTNACKYTPDGGSIVLAVRLLGENLSIEVRNLEAEIPASELSRIFDPFYRIPKQDPWRYGGTGLGLALVRKLIDRLRGSIAVTSDDRETVFMVTLPLERGTENPRVF
jgi:PAS domain S-box-containing protein